jgi:small-conductance mechanosensitive channel
MIDDRQSFSEDPAMRTNTPAVLIGFLFMAGLLASPVGRSAVAPPPGITRDEATQLLGTLQDPEKRENFTKTLEAYIEALPPSGVPAPAATSATAPGAQPAAKKPDDPSPLKRAFLRVQTAGTHLAQDLRAVTNLPALSSWLGGRFDDPVERNAFDQGILRILLIFAITIGVDAFLRWQIRRRRAPPAAIDASDSDTPPLRHTLRRLSARFGGIAGAALAGNAAIMFVADLPVTRTVAFGVVNTYVALGILLGVLDEFMRTENATSDGDTPAHQLPAGLRPLLIAFLIVVAMQLLSGDIADALGAPDAIQGALAKCIALVAHILAIILVLVSRPAVSRWLRRHARPGTSWAAFTEALAASWSTVAICAIAGSWLVWALDIPDAYREIMRLIFATLAVLLISRLISNLSLKTLDRRMTGFSSAQAGTLGSRLFSYRNVTRLVVKLLLVAATLLALTEAWGLHSFAWLGQGHAGHRFAAFTLQLLVLAFVGIVCWEGADLAFERRVNSLVDASSLSRATRLRTLQPIIRFALLVVIALLVVMTALNAVGINVGPLLAGASIVGVALGFGSQKLVQDFITGIFLLIEDAMDVGDAVTLAGVSGTVEHISIRSIRLRAGDGSVHLVPFSSVTSVNNSNRGVGNAAVSVNVDPLEDTDRVATLLSDIALQMRQEPRYAAVMQSDLQLWGVDKVDGSLVTIAGQIVCTDAGRWDVQREFNRRMKMSFEREHVKLAVPRQTLRIAPVGGIGTELRLPPASPSA